MPLARTSARGRLIRLGMATTALACLAATAACGSEDADTGSTGGGSASAAPFDPSAMQGYLSCLSKQGVPMPTAVPGGGASGAPSGAPPSGIPTGAVPSGVPSGAMPSGAPGGGTMPKPEGVDDATWQAAQTACAGQLPELPTN
ncbi:hypothetical protein [Micromonospora sp. RP3T]|uniref:hypothetical protein n=1 Tax=Micromonospora sp. RP3T TaxID=2135446 RepID=UPI003D740BA3